LLLLAVQACVVPDTAPVNPGYGYAYGPPGQYGPQGYANVAVGEPSPAYVSSMPPEPLYEQAKAHPLIAA